MRNTWHMASFAPYDKGDAREGTMSVFVNYDLCNQPISGA